MTNTIDTYVYRGLIKLNDIGMSSSALIVPEPGGLYPALVLGANWLV